MATPAEIAQAVFTCPNTACRQKPTKPCVYTAGKSKGKPRPEGSHAGRLLAAAQHLATLAAITGPLEATILQLQNQVADLLAQVDELEHAAPAPGPIPGRKVWFLYMPNFLNLGGWFDKNTLNPHGENDLFLSHGGYGRDKPLNTGDGTAKGMAAAAAKEVADAKDAGGDGFQLCVISSGTTSSGPQQWPRCKALMAAAADDPTFRVMPMIDCTGSTANKPAAEIARLFKELYDAGPAGWYVEDGALVLSSFTPERKTVAWWTDVLQEMTAAIGKPIKLQAIFQDYSTANMDAFAGVAYAYGKWGDPAPAVEAGARDAAKDAHQRGKLWIQDARDWDVRHKDGLYCESRNTELLRAGWTRARGDDGCEPADQVLVPTWNDIGESTHICPSRNHGTALAQLTRHEADWFRTGVEPKMPDTLVLSHRIQFVATLGSLPGLIPMKSTLGGGSKAGNGPRDAVEVITWAEAASTLRVTTGAVTLPYAVPAGFSVTTVPLKLGAISAQLLRGSVLVDVQSTSPVIADPAVQDLDYRIYMEQRAA